jgi:tetrahydromethanopterin S-methyltransferase subunit G
MEDPVIKTTLVPSEFNELESFFKEIHKRTEKVQKGGIVTQPPFVEQPPYVKEMSATLATILDRLDSIEQQLVFISKSMGYNRPHKGISE